MTTNVFKIDDQLTLTTFFDTGDRGNVSYSLYLDIKLYSTIKPDKIPNKYYDEYKYEHGYLVGYIHFSDGYRGNWPPNAPNANLQPDGTSLIELRKHPYSTKDMISFVLQPDCFNEFLDFINDVNYADFWYINGLKESLFPTHNDQ